MIPGRELDALIAEKVMGGHMKTTTQGQVWWDRLAHNGELPHYSTDIAAAWEVVEKLCQYSERHFVIEKTGAWLVRFREGQFTPGETAPHAICLAALKAVSNE